VTASNLSLRSGVSLTARSDAIETPFDLLDAYTSDGFAWLDGEYGFVTSGAAAVVAPADATAFLAGIRHSTTGVDVPATAGPRAVGALPFAGTGELVVPARIVARDATGRVWRTVIDGEHAPVTSVATGPSPSEFRVTAVTDRRAWLAMVEATLAAIDADALQKVVLARAVDVVADLPFDVPALLAYLRRSQPGCVVYADRGFVGASPELLVRKSGAAVVARPLAGTGVDTSALVRSAKDAHEHRLVVDAVVAALGHLCSAVRAEGPRPLELADVSHLATTVSGRADSATTSVTDLMTALHPTPAVAGTPRPLALATIDALEPVARARYAGPCGWVDARGDGEFVVALRGGVIEGNRARIHAGAGIVSGSDPGAEWAETQQKLMPMLQALVRP
jgi:menaquinone-specific isochorismate synthase